MNSQAGATVRIRMGDELQGQESEEVLLGGLLLPPKDFEFVDEWRRGRLRHHYSTTSTGQPK